MSNTDRELIAELEAVLTSQRYSPVVVGNYCAYARGFLDYLAQRSIPITEVTEAQVAQYLRHAIRCSANVMVDRQRRIGTPFRAPESTRCCGLHRASGRPPRK